MDLQYRRLDEKELDRFIEIRIGQSNLLEKTQFPAYNKTSGKAVKNSMSTILKAERNYLYDALEYAGQVEEAAKSHKKEREERKKKAGQAEKTEGEIAGGGNKKEPDAEEFLSGFGKEDKLIPSITLTILFSPKPWDGPRSLFEMMGVSDPAVQACMNDYRIHLIAPAQMTDMRL